MNESIIPSWFMEGMFFFALAQTGLLLLACLLIYDWGRKLNRKLHRIESNTRHAASAPVPETENVLGESW